MIKKYTFFILFLLFNSFIKSNIDNYFKYDPLLRFPTSWLIGSFGGLLLRHKLKKNPLNLYFLKKSLFSKEILLGGLFGVIFYETFFMQKFLPPKIKDTEGIDSEKKTNISRINIFIHGSLIAPEGATRPSGRRPIFTGFIRSIIQQFNRTSSVENMYKNKNEFANKKNRLFLFGQNLFPLLAGPAPGLYKINQHSVTQTAFDLIYKPFMKNQESHNELSFIFNWDGDLSEISRKFAGEKLREAIISINNNYPMASIYCYAHSHGGNVLLHSMQKKSTENEEQYKIKIGYLLGTPIGEKTENLIKNIPGQPYEKIFNIFSCADYVQKADVTFSWGKFPKRIINKKHKDIKNIELVIDKKSTIAHEDFFLYQKNKNNNSALVKFFHDFDQIIQEEQNEENSRYSLNTSTGKFTAID